MEAYKEQYNRLLERYNNGCNYIATHIDEAEKFLPELSKILKQMDDIIKEHNITDTLEIQYGFESQRN